MKRRKLRLLERVLIHVSCKAYPSNSLRLINKDKNEEVGKNIELDTLIWITGSYRNVVL